MAGGLCACGATLTPHDVFYDGKCSVCRSPDAKPVWPSMHPDALSAIQKLVANSEECLKIADEARHGLRDMFAGAAVQCFSIDREDCDKLVKGRERPLHEVVAKFCYDLADAMMAERKARSR